MWSLSVFRDSGAALLIVGSSGRITLANPAALALAGRNSLAGTEMADLLTAADHAALDAFLATLTTLPAGQSQALGPVRLTDGAGTRPVQMIGSRTQGPGDFDALVVAVHELPRASTASTGPATLVDPLTGVGTRARGLQALDQSVGPEAPGCLLVVDLDGFGWINESLGYAEGDRILVEVARRLQHAVPPGATVARIDGDQFLVVSPSTPLATSLELADAVFSAIATPMHIAGTRVVTVSVGAAGLAGSSVDEVLTQAQAAQVEAKGRGGQQVVLADPTQQTLGPSGTDVVAALREQLTDAQDEAAQAQREAALARLEARTCSKTGLPNHLAYVEAAEQLQSDARRTGSPVAVVFLDLDEFGTINKTFTWARGTATLAAVAQVLASQCRGEDRVFRFGGEEFVVLLADTDLEAARTVAERLRAAVEAAGIPHNGVPERPIVTLSIGVDAGCGPHLVIADLVDRADEWSQLAKSTGRNRVLPEAQVPREGDVVA